MSKTTMRPAHEIIEAKIEALEADSGGQTVACLVCGVIGDRYDTDIFADTFTLDTYCHRCADEHQKKQQRTAIDLRLTRCVPKRYAWALDNVELAPEITGWTGDPWAVVLQGKNGTGKTFMATRLLADIVRSEGLAEPVWIGAKELAHQLREAISTKEASPAVWLAKCSVLLIDDFRAVERNDGQATAFVADELEYILMQRDNWMRPTILTMDKPVSGLDPRIVSRLSTPYAISIVLDGKDRRAQPCSQEARQ